MSKRLGILAFALFFFGGCYETGMRGVESLAGVYNAPPKVRVLIAKSVGPEQKIEIRSQGPFVIYEASQSVTLLKGANLPAGRLSVTDEGVKLGEKLLAKGRIVIDGKEQGYIGVNDRLFRGMVMVIPEGDGKYSLINVLDLETYLRGVIPSEMPKDWPEDALRAQTIASRTWTLFQIKTHAKNPYDVTKDIFSQVYGGASVESETTDQAIDDTRGVILLYQKQLYESYYHSCCGGHTANVLTVWPKYEYIVPSLQGVKDPYCAMTPYSSWRISFTKAQIVSAFQKAFPGADFSSLQEIVPLEVGPSGHASKVRLMMAKGNTEISADGLRKFLGVQSIQSHQMLTLRSTRFSVVREGDNFWLSGKGNGHGVGLCQWGTREMALKKKGVQEILAHYYPASKLWRIY